MIEPTSVLSIGTTPASASPRTTTANSSSKSRQGTGSAAAPKKRRAASSLKAPFSPWNAARIVVISQLLARSAHLVADVADGLDDVAAGAQLGPQPPDVDVHRPGVAGVAVAPHPGQKLFPGEHP